MATTFQYGTTEGVASALTTELNSLASATRSAASASIDNTPATGGNYELMDVELNVTYGTNPSAGGYVALYLLPSLDGTNFADGAAATAPQKALLIGVFELRASTSAQRLALTRIPLPPRKFELLVDNQAGQAMAASGNTVKYSRFNEVGN